MKTIKTGAPIVFILGPTATGKTEVAIKACNKFGGEIINCDSIQFYSGLEIGSAKPKPEEIKGIVYNLIGNVPPGETYTAGDYCRDAIELIESKPDCPVFYVVGGSGFYAQALHKGMYPVESIPAEVVNAIEKKARDQGIGELYKELLAADRQYADKIGPNDSYRIKRALQLIRTHAKSVTDIQREFAQRPPSHVWPQGVHKIGLTCDRELLRQRVQKRSQDMLDQRFVDEVRQLLAKGLKDWPPLQSVGYKEVLAFLDGQVEEPELCGQIVTSTMQLAKRQSTWFRRDKEMIWFDCVSQIDKALSRIGGLLEIASK